jgi:hypothetical protein
MEDKDLDYESPYEPIIDEEKLNKQITVLNNFLSARRSKRKVSVTNSNKNLSHRVKLRCIGLVKCTLQSASLLVPSNDADILMCDAYNDVSSEDSNIILDGNFRQVMSGVSETYTNAESWQSRPEILSIVASKI